MTIDGEEANRAEARPDLVRRNLWWRCGSRFEIGNSENFRTHIGLAFSLDILTLRMSRSFWLLYLCLSAVNKKYVFLLIFLTNLFRKI